MRRLEELAKESSALKPHLIPPMKALSNLVPELVNFGISVHSFSSLMPVFLAYDELDSLHDKLCLISRIYMLPSRHSN